MLNPSEVDLGEEIEEMQNGPDRKNVSKFSHSIGRITCSILEMRRARHVATYPHHDLHFQLRAN